MLICNYIILLYFFFSSRRRHTRYIGDWSSDVCSSDLRHLAQHVSVHVHSGERGIAIFGQARVVESRNGNILRDTAAEIGRASCRERVWISVVGVSVNKKMTKT